MIIHVISNPLTLRFASHSIPFSFIAILPFLAIPFCHFILISWSFTITTTIMIHTANGIGKLNFFNYPFAKYNQNAHPVEQQHRHKYPATGARWPSLALRYIFVCVCVCLGVFVCTTTTFQMGFIKSLMASFKPCEPQLCQPFLNRALFYIYLNAHFPIAK